MSQDYIKSTAKDVFLQLFNFALFYIAIIAMMRLYVSYINVLFPDPLQNYYILSAEGVRWGSAVLLIAVPAFLLSAWLIAKEVKKDSQKRDLSLRKWLLYLTLFVSALTVVIDLMTFVYYFLSGELSMRFFLKVMVFLIVALLVFLYYWWELKHRILSVRATQGITTVVVVVVLGSIIAGFFIVGTPGQQRNKRLDVQRVQHLQQMQSQIINYWQQKDVLPADLTTLQDPFTGFILPHDPITNDLYEYIVTGDLSFELCAVFETVGDSKDMSLVNRYEFPYEMMGQNWDHSAGHVCFERTIDPDLYKNNNDNLYPKAVL